MAEGRGQWPVWLSKPQLQRPRPRESELPSATCATYVTEGGGRRRPSFDREQLQSKHDRMLWHETTDVDQGYRKLELAAVTLPGLPSASIPSRPVLRQVSAATLLKTVAGLLIFRRSQHCI